MSSFYVGQITLFGGNYAPRAWHLCDGSLLKISSYTSLFSLIGNQYGGDGISDFALPDLRGRAPISQGTGLGLTPRSVAQRFGDYQVTLSSSQNGSHNHAIMANTGGAVTTAAPTGAALAELSGSTLYNGAEVNHQLDSSSIESAGGATPGGAAYPHSNMAPYIALNYIICTAGLYPPRS
jgi:microcystin-dependent protein